MVSIKGHGEVDWDFQKMAELVPPRFGQVPGFAFKFQLPGVSKVGWFKMSYNSLSGGFIETFPKRPRQFHFDGANNALVDMNTYLARLGFSMSDFIQEVTCITLAPLDKTNAFEIEIKSGPCLYLTVKNQVTTILEPTEFINAMARKLSAWFKNNWEQQPPCSLGSLPKKEFVLKDKDFETPSDNGLINLHELPVKAYATHMMKVNLERFESYICDEILLVWKNNECVVLTTKDDLINGICQKWESSVESVKKYVEQLIQKGVISESN